MRIIVCFLLLSCRLVVYAQQNGTVSPLFRRVVSTPDNKVYDTKAWSAFTGSPVRATPLVKDRCVYFGNAGGDFFALDKKTGDIKWKYHTGAAIHSSAIAENGKLYFSDNRQAVYALNETTGKLLWKFAMDKKMDYPWRYD
ncbi:MAG: PQQ-binding-like beta-propeller repeat protein [Bacteroidota bacterium]